MVIDAHAHACGELGSVTGIMAYLNQNCLDKIVLCPGEEGSKRNYPVPMIADLFATPKVGYGFNRVIQTVVRRSGAARTLAEQNSLISNLTKADPEHILQAYWLDPMEKNWTEAAAAAYLANPFCMVKLHQCWHSFDLRSREIQLVVEWALQYRLPIFIHLLSAEQGHALCSTANAYPDCRFIAGHMIGFDVIAAGLRYDNVYFDLSAPFMIPMRYLVEAARRWRGRRLLLGSDTPYGNGNIRKNKRRIAQLDLSEDEKDRILGGNFAELIAPSQKRQHLK